MKNRVRESFGNEPKKVSSSRPSTSLAIEALKDRRMWSGPRVISAGDRSDPVMLRHFAAGPR